MVLTANRRKCGAIVLAVCLTYKALCAQPAPKEQPWQESERNETLLVNAVSPVLKSCGMGMRIEYGVTCRTSEDKRGLLVFPKVKTQSAPKQGAALERIRHVFVRDPRVVVSQQSPNVILVGIGHVDGALLRTKIARLKLSPTEQYNTFSAESALVRSGEMETALQRLHLDDAPVVASEGLVRPDKKLPSSLRNVTIGEALDQIAATFGVISVYGECTNPPPGRKRIIIYSRYF